MQRSSRRLSVLLFAFVLTPGAGAPAAAQPALRVPWFHVHEHGSACFKREWFPFGGYLCVDVLSRERDLFLFRNGAVEEVNTFRRSSPNPAFRVPLHTEIRRGAIGQVEVAAVRQDVADSRFSAQRGGCDPLPPTADAFAQYEVVWYQPSTLTRTLVLSWTFDEPCSPELMGFVQRLLDLAADLPLR